eukprot:4980576-Prymnesium_polylepis.1
MDIPTLTPVARFVVDPTISHANLLPATPSTCSCISWQRGLLARPLPIISFIVRCFATVVFGLWSFLSSPFTCISRRLRAWRKVRTEGRADSLGRAAQPFYNIRPSVM